MHKDHKSFDTLQSFPQELLDSLILDTSLPTIEIPYTTVQDFNGDDLYEAIDLIFYNTEAFSATGKKFLETGKYTNLHPVYQKKEFTAFWDEEERRRKEGITLPAVITQRSDGSYCLQNLHITGAHYGYLNFAPIKRVSKDTLDKINKMVLNDEDISELSDDKVEALPQFFDSDYYYFKAVELAKKKGKHLVVGKARRKGYSYKNGWLCADKADLVRNSTTVLGAYHADSLYPEGTMTMTDNYLQHIAKHTDWSKRRSIDRENVIKFGYTKNDGLGIEYGFKSRILAVSFATNNPGAARGKDSDFVLLEESGKNPLLSQVLASTLPTLGAGAVATGLMVVFGTGGGESNQWEGFEDLMYAPSADGFLPFNNVWDKDARGTECGFFVASFVGKEGFVDKHGNSDVQGAITYELKMRDLKKKSRKATKLSDYIMEEPFNPSEAFSRNSSGIFQQEEFEEQLRRVQNDPDIRAITRTGNLVNTKKGVVFKDKMFMTEEELKHYHPPIINFPLKKDDDPHGCFVMWQPPFRDRISGLIPENLYRIWHDPFAIDKDGKKITSRDSLGQLYVYERTNNFTPGKGDRIVAAFRGRPDSVDAYNEILFKVADYYNAIIMFENDRGDVKNYAKQHKRLHQLADEPDVIWKKALQTTKSGRNKGITINTNRKLDGVIYARDWFGLKRGQGENSESLLNLHYFYDEAGIKEILRFTLEKGNFDAVSTIIVGQYDMKEQFYTEIEKPVDTREDQDNIFNRAYY